MNLRMQIKEYLGYKDQPRTVNAVVLHTEGADIVVGKITFSTVGKKRVVLSLISQVFGETTVIGRYETVADALVAADDYLTDAE